MEVFDGMPGGLTQVMRFASQVSHLHLSSDGLRERDHEKSRRRAKGRGRLLASEGGDREGEGHALPPLARSLFRRPLSGSCASDCYECVPSFLHGISNLPKGKSESLVLDYLRLPFLTYLAPWGDVT
jgi:hypothetical protein